MLSTGPGYEIRCRHGFPGYILVPQAALQSCATPKVLAECGESLPNEKDNARVAVVA